MSDTSQQVESGPTPTSGSSLADMIVPVDAARQGWSLSAATWVKMAILAALFVAMNYWQFQILVRKWRHDPDWSHGFLIPLFSLYVLYSRRDELLSAPRRINLWGLAIMIVGVLLTVYSFGVLGNDWTFQLSMILVLFGMVLYLAGWRVMRVAWVPIVYLALAMPIPQILYGQIAVPLQGLAATSSGFLLRLFGVEISVTVLNLRITSISGEVYGLTVAEACSGVRSLMAFVALSVAMAYVEDRPNWQRLVLVLAGVPIAVVCNILRVTLTSAMYVHDRPELGTDFMHEFMGIVLLIPALLLLVLLSRLMRSVYIEEDVEDGADEADTQAPIAEGGTTP